MRTVIAILATTAIALAGCVNVPSSAIEQSDVAGLGGLVDTAIDHAGTTSTNACVNNPAMPVCQGESSPTTTILLEAPGNLTRIVAEVAWTPASPATTELGIDLIERTSDGGYTLLEGFTATGPSPIAVDWDLTSVADLDLEFYVHPVHTYGAGPGGVTVRVPQDFTVTGNLTSTA